MKTKVLALSAVCLFLSQGAQASAADDKNAVIAEVGPNKLTVAQFEEQMKTMPPQLQMALMQNPQLREQLLDRWVQINLFAEEAKVMKLDQGKDFKARLDDVKNTLLAQEYLAKEVEGKAPPEVTKDEIKSYYDNNKKEFTQPESVKARHILIRVAQDADEKAWKDAETKIKDVKKQLDKGKDFADLAKQYSEDPGTKERGGIWASFPRARWSPSSKPPPSP